MLNADPAELEKFGDLAHRWWDPNSEFKPLHDINPLRLDWIDAAIGLAGAIAQMLLIEAFRSAPASVISPFEYTALFWGITIDWVVWSALPSLRVLTGGAIVVGSGLYLIWRERQLALAPPIAARTAEGNVPP